MGTDGIILSAREIVFKLKSDGLSVLPRLTGTQIAIFQLPNALSSTEIGPHGMDCNLVTTAAQFIEGRGGDSFFNPDFTGIIDHPAWSIQSSLGILIPQRET